MIWHYSVYAKETGECLFTRLRTILSPSSTLEQAQKHIERMNSYSPRLRFELCGQEDRYQTEFDLLSD